MTTATETANPRTATPEAVKAGTPVTGEADDRRADYVADFQTFEASRPAWEPETVRELRRGAIERFAEIGFPHRRQEAWRKTDVRPVSQGTFRRATGPAPAPGASLAPHLWEPAVRLVFVDGFLALEHSQLDGLPQGVYAGSLATALEESPELVEPHLGRHAAYDDHPFVALSSAFFSDGAFIHVPRGTVVETPIHLLFLSSVAGDGEDGDTSTPVVSYPRNLFVAGENSQSTIVETYAAFSAGAYFTCPVTEVVMEQAAVVDHYKVQHDSRESFHLSTLQVHQERDSNFFSHSISAGGDVTRNDVNAYLGGEGIECTLNGLYMVNGKQLVDNHMRVDHAFPNCNSYELYKGVLDGKAKSVFNGLIYVHQDAQNTDAKQSNRNLLLSEGALASSNPQLEIFADDVRCTHGSTVGQLDPEAIFYLRSRGIGEDAALSLLTYAFASDIVGRIKVEPVRKDLEEFLFERLPRGEIVRQAV